ncbi:disease resistance protein RGA4-like [Triticum dicoccoides]|uniref:disease resistance protein RGA4-like n=1 Tax=Triticum dicoccoides TaxID=85692 RepID=UPI000E7AA67E|nr:disease resistance protein RGA4-like [Triticum dicoccoides]
MAFILPIINTVLKGITLVSKLRNESSKLDAEIRSGLKSISRELGMIRSAILQDKYEDLQNLELVYEIEDFIDHIRVPEKKVGTFCSVIGIDHDPRHEQLTEIRRFEKKLESINYEKPNKNSESTQIHSGATSSAEPPCYTPEEDLVGFPEAKVDLLKRLVPPPQLSATHDRQLRVITIVGCGGLGKTALARALYEDRTVIAGAFDCKAWVAVPDLKDEKNIKKDILEKILQQVGLSFKGGKDGSAPSSSNTTSEEDHPTAASSDLSTSEVLRRFLAEKRYLVCIDDVQQKQVWNEIETVLPKNEKGSRILVTTNVDSVAMACSLGSYVYRMKYLDRLHSETLLWSKALGPSQKPSTAVLHNSESIFVKCDGLPLALISAGKYLKGGLLSMSDCKYVGRRLGDFLVGNEPYFAEIKRALSRGYNNLRDYNQKSCLLYASIFPRGHPIDIRSLSRRLIAEELVDKDVDEGLSEALGLARECLKELINQSMIERVLVDSNDESCKLQSIILEFTMGMSLSKNFVSLIDRHWTIRNKGGPVRRLITVQPSSEDGSSGVSSDTDLSTVRSLTIIKRNLLKRGPGYFKDCNVLRVLDLEGCTGIDSGIIGDICGLEFLNYLGLRKTDVNQLPERVKKLRLLQTLDIRDTGVEELPMEVIMLPGLAYLFGKFELQQLTSGSNSRLVKFLSTQSKLHTLSGVLLNGARSHEVLLVIQHAKMLKKVKLWCKDTNAPANVATYGNKKNSNSPGSQVQPKRAAPSGENVPVLLQLLKRKKLSSGVACGHPSAGSSDPGNSTPDQGLASRLANAIGKRPVEDGLDSLSIDFNDFVPSGFLLFLKEPASTISSIKASRLSGLLPCPAVLQELRNLNKLHLFSTGRIIEDLAELQSLPCLEYLKLAEDQPESWDGNFNVEADGFNSLLWLCFEAQKQPCINIKRGGMKNLASLLLLCPKFPPRMGEAAPETGVDGILYLAYLNEVILHRSARKETVEAWETASEAHINKPYVKKQQISTPSEAMEVEDATN